MVEKNFYLTDSFLLILVQKLKESFKEVSLYHHDLAIIGDREAVILHPQTPIIDCQFNDQINDQIKKSWWNFLNAYRNLTNPYLGLTKLENVKPYAIEAFTSAMTIGRTIPGSQILLPLGPTEISFKPGTTYFYEANLCNLVGGRPINFCSNVWVLPSQAATLGPLQSFQVVIKPQGSRRAHIHTIALPSEI